MRKYLGAGLVIAGLCLASLVWAGDKCPSKQAAAQGKASCSKAKSACGAPADQAALTKIDSYRKANVLLAAWSNTPAKLAALTEEDKKNTQSLGRKVMTEHPAGQHFMPAMAFLNDAVATLVALDDATSAACGTKCGPGAKKASAGGCPKKAAALAAAAAKSGEGCPQKAQMKARWSQRVALTAKTNELMLAAGTAMGKGGECVKSASACSKAKTCDKAAGAKLTKGEGKADACCKSKKAAATVASAKGGCAESKKSACTKSLVAKADDLVKQSATLAAGWRGSNAVLAAMNASDRSAADHLLASAQAACPIGALMPGTLGTVKALLAEAGRLDAAGRIQCDKNAKLSASIPNKIKDLQKTRMTLSCAVLNLLDQMDVISTPPKQLASAN